jgi:hypothetical protein
MVRILLQVASISFIELKCHGFPFFKILLLLEKENLLKAIARSLVEVFKDEITTRHRWTALEGLIRLLRGFFEIHAVDLHLFICCCTTGLEITGGILRIVDP